MMYIKLLKVIPVGTFRLLNVSASCFKEGKREALFKGICGTAVREHGSLRKIFCTRCSSATQSRQEVWRSSKFVNQCYFDKLSNTSTLYAFNSRMEATKIFFRSLRRNSPFRYPFGKLSNKLWRLPTAQKSFRQNKLLHESQPAARRR